MATKRTLQTAVLDLMRQVEDYPTPVGCTKQVDRLNGNLVSALSWIALLPDEVGEQEIVQLDKESAG